MRDSARRAVGIVALATFALHLAFAAQYGWFRDELYYVACARRLAWGYVDHPPFVALVARLALALFGESLVGLRAFAALAAAATAIVAGELARVMGGGRYAQGLAAFATAAAPYHLVVGQIYTMNGFEPLIWGSIALVAAHALVSASKSPSPALAGRGLVWLGPLLGIGILNKFSVTWLAAGLVLAILASRQRRLLLRRDLWLAAGIGALLVLPHVLWQVRNDFPTREFARNALTGKNEPYTPLGFLWQQVELMHPLSAPLWIGGLVALLFAKRLRPVRPLGIAYVFVGGLIVVASAKAYYLGPAYTWLFAAGAVVFEDLTRARARAARFVFVALLGLGSVVLLPMAVPVLSVASFQRYFTALGGFGEAKSGERQKAAALPQLYADMHGWPEMAASVAAVVDALPPEDRASVAVLASNYGKASAVEMFGRSRGITEVVSGDNGWWLWGPPRPSPAGSLGWPRTVVAIGFSADDLAPWFADTREVARADHPLARADERDLPIVVCHAPRVSVEEAWPRMKHYR